jgi:putative Holliday junction resolvase
MAGSPSTAPITIVALDVGEKRIGVAYADTGTRIPVAKGIVTVDGSEVERIKELYGELQASALVLGYPRNQSGEPTAQTSFVEAFGDRLRDAGFDYVFQDESLTSVLAEEYLSEENKPYTKGDIDARAAAIILEDYLRVHYA